MLAEKRLSFFLLNVFLTNVLFLYPLKTSENYDFRGDRNGTLARNRLITISEMI